VATQAELLNAVRSRLDEATPRFWEDEELRRWVNEGARDVARRAEVLQDVENIAVTAGTHEYTLAADLIRVYRVVWKPAGMSNHVPLDYQDFNSMDSAGWTWTNAQGWPSVFTMWGYPPNLKLVLYPKPTSAGSLDVFYYRFPAQLALDGSDAASEVDLPNGWEDLVIAYTEMVALRKDANPRWVDSKALYEQGIAEMMERTRRWTDQAGGITTHGGYLPGWLVNSDDGWGW
jgi:hypothetical protein